MNLPTLTVCFIWHMHQPDYKDHLTRRYLMPWVRLHGVKDYLDMVAILEEFPKIRQTFNLVPSLIDQIEDYCQPGIWDRHQEVALKTTYTDDDRRFILERFFDANPDHMISRIPYYHELFLRKIHLAPYGVTDEELSHFSDIELADITAMFHLVWMDPRWVDAHPEIQTLFDKGRGYTQPERARILEIQREILCEILPTYRKFQESGQIEVSVTPYYHPILPLLVDTNSARVGQPDAILPSIAFQHPEDARSQLEKSIVRYREIFGHEPVGMWPSEQSISPAVVKLLGEMNFAWAVSSEGNLARSLGIHWDKDEWGHTRNMEQLVRPYEYEGVKLLFRNLALSDLIGFSYARHSAEGAADDFYHRLKQVQHHMARHPEITHPVVTIALDGENCWENYHMDGIPFLRALYKKLSEDATLNVSRVQDFLESCPPSAVKKLDTLHSGSWIEDNFRIWIGDPMKNLAWRYLKDTRDELVGSEAAHILPPDVLRQAWQEIYIAEGSDWFWWYGEPNTSGQDALFDEQFRLHLRNVYTLLGKQPPEYLNVPVPGGSTSPLIQPAHPIQPELDGLITHAEEWRGAGLYDFSWGTQAMHLGDRPITRLFYGYDEENLYVRFDLLPDLLSPSTRLALYFCNMGAVRHNSPIRLKVHPGAMTATQKFLYAFEIQFTDLQSPTPKALCAEAVADHLWVDRPDIPVRLANANILEMSVPFDYLKTGPGGSLLLAVALAENEVITDFVPGERLPQLTRPIAAPGPTSLSMASAHSSLD